MRTTIFVVFVSFVVLGCSRSAPRQELRQVDLPDLSAAAASVQSQVRERYAALKPVFDDASKSASDRANAYGDMGTLLMAAEYQAGAEACLLNAQTLAPADMRWPYYLGNLHRIENRLDQAAAFFEQALRLKPDDLPTLVWLSDIHLTQGRPEAAEPLLSKARSLDPDAAAVHYGLGRVALAKRDYAAAATHLELALAKAPNASRVHYPLALAYRGLGDPTRAEEHLRQRGDAELTPPDPLMEKLAGQLQNAAAFEVRASEALGRRDWADAITNLRSAIALAPNNAFTRLNLGTALYLTGDASGAMEQLEIAVRLSPGLAKAHYSIGVISAANGREEKAIEALETAVRADANLTDARLQLADALRRTGRVEQSLTHYAEVMRSSPSISEAHFGSGMALVRLGRYREALARLETASKTFPEQAGFAHAVARLKAAAPDPSIRNGAGALAIVERLLQQQRTIGLGETMAMTLAELGRFDDAIRWQRDVIAAANQGGQTDVVRRLTVNLNLYEQRRPCRTPWAADDPVFFPKPAN